MLVVRVARRLAAPLLVARDWAEVGDLDDDRLERAREGGRVWVCVRGDSEATAARIPGPEAWRRAECELAHCSSVAIRGHTARCGVREQKSELWVIGHAPARRCGARTWLRAPGVVSEGRAAGRVLDIAACGTLVGDGDTAGYRHDRDKLDEE